MNILDIIMKDIENEIKKEKESQTNEIRESAKEFAKSMKVFKQELIKEGFSEQFVDKLFLTLVSSIAQGSLK